LKSRILSTINVVGAARGGAQKQASRLRAVRDLCRADPSTRGATAPQRAQRVNFVVCRDLHAGFEYPRFAKDGKPGSKIISL